MEPQMILRKSAVKSPIVVCLLLSYYLISVPSGVLIILLLFLFLALGKCLSAITRRRAQHARG